jgi:hypothetical protein
MTETLSKYFATTLFMLALAGCGGPAERDNDGATPAPAGPEADATSQPRAADPAHDPAHAEAIADATDRQRVTIRAVHNHETNEHLFHLDTPEIDAGWTTLRLVNASPDEHFVLMARMPTDEGQYEDPVTFEYWQSNVTEPFQQAMNNIVDPDVQGDAAFAPFDALPDWFGDVAQFGGPGLTAPGRTVETTVYLEPGTYVMECYVKDDDEQFHSYLGMIEQFTVRETVSAAHEPEADLRVTLSSTEGIRVDGDLVPGTHTVAVHFEDQTTYEHMVGHDVHLVRLNGTDVETVARWMNWMVPGALVAPAPATFLGGAQTMTAGSTAYVTVDLEPGDYAWVSEVPADHQMWQTFTVLGSDPDK